MNTLCIKEFKNRKVLERLLKVPFFSDVKSFSQKEFDEIINASSVVRLRPGEVLLDHGDMTRCFYVLLEGQLDVFPEEPSDKAIGKIFGAQIFGALGAINDQPRTATVVASRTGQAYVLAIDFDVFGELEDFSRISINTKIAFYANVVNNTRYKIRQIEFDNGTYKFNGQSPEKKLLTYKKNSLAQLHVLGNQAKRLGAFLESFNQQSVPSIALPQENKAKMLLVGLVQGFVENVKTILLKKVI